MGCDPIVLRRAAARLAGQRQRRQEELAQRRQTLFDRSPELARVDRQLRGTILEVITNCLKAGTDPGPALRVIKDRNMALQDRQAQLLRELGCPPDALADVPLCRTCGDTGWVKGEMCGCLKALCAQEQVKELARTLDVENQTFDTFSLDWYSALPWPGEGGSPRENMEFIYEVCLNYAQKFEKFYFKNLFLTGDPGLGKTFLSACIARTVAENGFWVVYDTAVHVFSKFEEQKFAKNVEEEQEARRETRRYLNCDLLILDDLGSELTTPFVQSALYTLVNTRLTRDRRTVISSNLTMDGVRARYAGQTASRLEGEYRVLRFFGDDIRLKRSARL